MNAGPYRFWAFISYSHKDRRFATWLHDRLERSRIPRRLRVAASAGLDQGRLAPVFIDHAELAAGHNLAAAIRTALEASRFLIVVASPDAVRSAHVSAEVDYFISCHTCERVLPVILAGRPNALSRGYPAAEECFPEALRARALAGADDGSVASPYAADARGGPLQWIRAFRRIAAGLLGVSYEALYRRHRRRVAMQIVASAAVISTIFISWYVPHGQLEHLGLFAEGFFSKALPRQIGGNPAPWVGVWTGSISSTCGNYTGPLTAVITVAGPHLLRLEYNAGGISRGSYTLSYYDRAAVSHGIPGAAYYSINGKSMRVTYPETCQTGVLSRAGR